MKPGRSFFERNALDVAAELIGMRLLFQEAGGIIVETEAYLPDDPASHSFKGRTERNAAMFGPAAHAYVYRSYGMHWCLNIVCLPGSAVLLRAIEPKVGIEAMRERRKLSEQRLLCAGPGRLCQALGITRAENGMDMLRRPFTLSLPSSRLEVTAARRIGISRAAENPWRFVAAGSPYLSRKPS